MLRLINHLKDFLWRKDLLVEKDWRKVVDEIESEEEWGDD